MDVLRPVIKPYAWGSRHAIATLQGRPAADGPEAELWMGAHPSGPSGVSRDGAARTLDEVIAADPMAELGEQTVARFGPRLPFLLKVLAAECALSIQVHPSRAQAEAGFRAERGLPAGDPARNFTDDWPKPELLTALTPFEVLVGLRDAADAAALLRALDVPVLKPVADQLAAAGSSPGDAGSGPAGSGPAGSGPAALADALRTILTWPADGRAALVADVAAACARLGDASADSPYAPACAALTKVASDHPGDLGLVAALLMRYAKLEPGQAAFMPAGGLHAYLRGTGVELLANSDNVIRAGLTGKHIDVPELLALADPAVAVPVLTAREIAPGISEFDTPAPEFHLYRLHPGAASLAEPPLTLPGTAAPRIVLCVEGTATLRHAIDAATARTVTLTRGESAFLPASLGEVALTGPASIFLATPGPVALS